MSSWVKLCLIDLEIFSNSGFGFHTIYNWHHSLLIAKINKSSEVYQDFYAKTASSLRLVQEWLITLLWLGTFPLNIISYSCCALQAWAFIHTHRKNFSSALIIRHIFFAFIVNDSKLCKMNMMLLSNGTVFFFFFLSYLYGCNSKQLKKKTQLWRNGVRF